MSPQATVGELEQLVANIAIHPDAVVTHRDNAEGFWEVVIDGTKVVATFDPEDEATAGALVVDLRDKADDRAARRDLVAGIRDLATFLEEHPEIPVDNVWASKWSTGTTVEQFKAAADALRPLGFTIDERPSYSSTEVALVHRFGPVEFKVTAAVERVCTTTVEVKEVTETVLPEWARPPQDVVLTEVAA